MSAADWIVAPSCDVSFARTVTAVTRHITKIGAFMTGSLSNITW
jgi:hypothetical protein